MITYTYILGEVRVPAAKIYTVATEDKPVSQVGLSKISPTKTKNYPKN